MGYIKPNNILVDYDESAEGLVRTKSVQISDLEDTVIVPPGKWLRGPLCGNAIWRSPESWCRSRQNQASDVFSFGIVMIYVMVNEMVFRVSDNELEAADSWRYVLRRHISYFADEDSFNGLLQHIGKENIFYERLVALANSFTPGNFRQPFKSWDYVDPSFRDLVGKMTNLDPTRRITAREALQHCWFGQLRLYAMMQFFDSLLSWRAGLMVGAVLLSPAAHASPAVNVALSASFSSPPYLLELLETAAEENTTCYFPLLDRVADGIFAEAQTEKDLYNEFLRVLQDEGHVASLDALSSFKLAMSLRSTAPRIQAHYQYYNTSVEPSMMAAQDAVCQVWAHYSGQQYCSPSLEHAQQGVLGNQNERLLPFDRVLGTGDESLVVYADISAPMFGEFHKELSRRAMKGEFSYKVRYRPSSAGPSGPLFVSGYGVQLALKKTDYIVMDDRGADLPGSGSNSASENSKSTKVPIKSLEDVPLEDLKPLSAAEVSTLGVNAASFVMNSENPFGSLLKLSQDFPRHSSAVTNLNVSAEFLEEWEFNKAHMFPSGYNVMWVNGVQINSRLVNGFSLLTHLRNERRLIKKFQEVGLSAADTVNLLSDSTINSHASDATSRYDYRDETEGNGVIIWLNNVEKDKRYEDWPRDVSALLQQLYPGQFPQVRRDIHYVVIPLNLADLMDINMLARQLQMFITRKIPVNFGFVPMVTGKESLEQFKLGSYLYQTYGLKTLMRYFEALGESKQQLVSPDKSAFDAAVQDREPRPEQTVLTFEEILSSDQFEHVLTKTNAYLQRLSIDKNDAPFFANGAILSRDENWIQLLISRLAQDLEEIQQAVMTGIYDNDFWFPNHYLDGAILTRNSLIIPEDPSEIQMQDLTTVYKKHQSAFDTIPRIPASADSKLESWGSFMLIADLDNKYVLKQCRTLLEFREKHPELEIFLLHHSGSNSSGTVSTKLAELSRSGRDTDVHSVQGILPLDSEELLQQAPETVSPNTGFESLSSLAKDLGANTTSITIIFNGRLVGPITTSLSLQELDQLLVYEQRRRSQPLVKAISALELEDKIKDPFALARLVSLTTRATKSDISEDIYDKGPVLRTGVFSKWKNTHTGFTISSAEDATIQIVATIDPASEGAQSFAPILKVLSNLHGVAVKVFLSPATTLKELPVKRFYRQVLDSEPLFNADGSLKRPGASFEGLPREALLTLGMDVPPSWLVAPKESVFDLDNIKLSSLKETVNVDAIYELEHILIEGHSRDMSNGSPPRGVQLLLGTERNPHFIDTIVMANLGYFQFKAQPGYWQITLKPGSSERIFKLDSAGSMGYIPTAGDETGEVALLSFQGTTLFPRLSRKPGHEQDDVLDPAAKPGSAKDYIAKGVSFASGIFSGVTKLTRDKQADINIFSVASGHLYERMLNIMMVSVMRHTKHSVKFWFIEQFLSPSFKSFLPHLAREYGFSYEMVTYKWPHWLRAQKEKQREIWGYKILFLDVLFPLSLDKVIFVDADQIVRTDMYDLITMDLGDAPYGFTPMCDSRAEIEGFRFWKQGYWKKFLEGLPYHISALYVVDLNRFRQIAAGDRLRGQYQALSADPNSLSNLDQDLPNHMQHTIPIKSLPQDWLWCETWCSDDSLKTAKTIDLCNNPMTKEPKLDRARRQVPEWTAYDDEIAALGRKVAGLQQQADTEKDGQKPLSKDEL
ncbi:killer toxin resistant protein [Ophidiomyces ophidiicola]|uniref:Killer toxin resistant protein n=1 Tax=Ophidiomyces ophidiicola TaxID=1387563 RepID=A0ACB8V215_9EURO|nr:killer toxin resistant protein [Ophidiomyces ophidiicola]KAI2055559.1 killer toxin resistant protein [Ophidiomyces ophidiicola]KAI2071700.1 killer toxin resistant protein [Ophidiomyces ophidiicola]KAI2128908.1 killer toxin resistant protein [Ophidiomyces ophidiicola]KAI2150861.1 killer toxin resistant protein [Ophidiomyces ophidiicola]